MLMNKLNYKKEMLSLVIEDPSICYDKLKKGIWTKHTCLNYCEEVLEQICLELDIVYNAIETEESQIHLEDLETELEILCNKRDTLINIIQECE